MNTIIVMGKRFKTTINTDDMNGEQYREFMAEVIECGLREVEYRRDIERRAEEVVE